MLYIIDEQNESDLAVWRINAPKHLNVEFKLRANPESRAEYDSMIIAGIAAHDRYGGFPNSPHAQVLLNHSTDSLPRKIIATPPYGPVFQPIPENRAHEALMKIFSACWNAVREFNGTHPNSQIYSIYINVAALLLGKVPKETICKAFFGSIERNLTD